MAWGRIDDGLYDHPKLDKLGRDRLAGVGLHTLAISWSNRRSTDGVIPPERVRLLGGTMRLADRLVEAGLFERHPEGYLVHDFLEYNDSAEVVAERRAAAADRQRRHRERERDVTRDSDAPVTRDTRRESRHSTRAPAAARPDPTRPSPDHGEIPPPPAERGTKGRRATGTSPRQQGTSPRQTGENPRANGESPRQEREAEKRGPTRLGEIFAEAQRRQSDTTLDLDEHEPMPWEGVRR